jgi:hypothetical protein
LRWQRVDSHTVEELRTALDRWLRAGFITTEQADVIARSEGWTTSTTNATESSLGVDLPADARRTFVGQSEEEPSTGDVPAPVRLPTTTAQLIVEGFGYLGTAIVLAAVLLIARSWDHLNTASHLASLLS